MNFGISSVSGLLPAWCPGLVMFREILNFKLKKSFFCFLLASLNILFFNNISHEKEIQVEACNTVMSMSE